MTPKRLNALTDGVVAIVLTIMVFQLRVPAEPTFQALHRVLPLLATYLLAFVNVAIYWNNHHHMMQAVEKVSGAVLWANAVLLFWLSLVPLAIRWLNDAGITAWPTAAFGLVLTLSCLSYLWLEAALIRAEVTQAPVRRALRSRRKETISFTLYAVSIPIAFVSPYLALIMIVVVAIIWLFPDHRFRQPAA